MKIRFVTLGCKLNFAETSALGRQLSEIGFVKCKMNEEADVVIINTCSVTDTADKKGRQMIHRMIKKHPNAYIVVTGCYAQLKPEEITEDVMEPSAELNEVLAATADKLGKKIWKGYVHSSDNFYSDFSIEREPAPYDLLCAEMESFGLFANARHLGKKAACILTISDSIVDHKETTPEQRQTGFTEMMEVALNAAIEM